MQTRTEEDQRKIDRRTALRRAAAAGGALWVIPAVQTINMTKAWALGSPGEVCYTVKLAPECDAPSPRTNVAQAYGCLHRDDPDNIVTDQSLAAACAKVSPPAQNTNWMVTLDEGCRLVAGFSKCGSGSLSCKAASSPPGSTGTIMFVPCDNGRAISHVELTICCRNV